MELSGTENCIVPLCTWLDYHEIRMAVFRLRSQPCTQLRTFQGHWATGHWLLWTDANGRACGTGLRSALCPSRVLCMCAKLLQSCLTLCDPMDCSPPGFSVHGASPGEKAGMGCHALLQWILPTKGLNPWLLHLPLSHQEAHVLFISGAQSCLTLCDPWNAAHQASLSITNTRSCSNACPLSQWCHPTISSSASTSPSAFNLSQDKGLSQWVKNQVTKVLGFQLQHQSFQWIFRTDFLWNWLVSSPCSQRDSQESYPTPQFKSINSSVLSFLYGPAFTSTHDYLECDSFD